MNNVERLLTVAEVAERLRVHQNTIYLWISEGRFPAVRAGRVIRIPEGTLGRFLAAGVPWREPAPESQELVGA